MTTECYKIKFDSRGEAEKELKVSVKRIQGRNKERKNKKQVPKRAYKCELCNKWHLTSFKHEKNKTKALQVTREIEK